jgi:protein-tyrosine-phosphatase
VARKLKAAIRLLHSLPERLLHNWRRHRTLQRLAESPPVVGVLFICYGNVCRSPFAAGLFRDLIGTSSGASVASAGFVGPDRSAPKQALDAALRFNVNLRDHRSTLVTHRLIKAADLIVVMSPEQSRGIREMFGPPRGITVVLGDLDPEPITLRTIVDPWGCDDSVFDDSYARIQRCVRELVSAIRVSSPRPEANSHLRARS